MSETLHFLEAKSSPKDGDTGVPIENVGIKLYFDGNVTDSGVWEANKTAFTLEDSEGNPVNYLTYQGHKEGEEGYILVLADPTPATEGQPGQLAQKSGYTLTVSPDLTSAGGAALGEEVQIGFETMDVAANSKLSMILMVVMMVAMFALMFVGNWRKMKAEAEAAALMKANPYRLAKDKSITVDEAKALIEKAKEKNRKQLEKTGGKAPEPEAKKSAAPRLEQKKKKKNMHKVKGPRPVSDGGSTYKSGRRAEAERKAKVDASRKAAAGQRQGASGARKPQNPKNKRKK